MNSDYCPRCGAPTIKRKSRKNGNSWTPGKWFIGCIQYPRCGWSAPIPTKSDLEQERQMNFLREIFWRPRIA